ncbi:PqqD family protein [Thermogemmatispora tikiterensis]|uniref:Uncharacterized protein n=1 Tax=Thermogemmatispora tikiterensis TaxID=1825093 RepID=A0A328VII4_9CHLR|nr:PqqD family protein [Thermogemmatispora tikiterensis]RAQ95912.1 hypothetical protein A4R35_10225 [Thermogemmatispora tikiterensis]
MCAAEVRRQAEQTGVASPGQRAAVPLPLIFATPTAEGGVLLDLCRGRYLGLTPRGWSLWEALQVGKRGQELVSVLQQQGIGEEEAKEAVCRFEQEMVRLALHDPELPRPRRGISSFLLWVLRCCPSCWEPLDAWLTLGGIRWLLRRADGLLLVIAVGQTLQGTASDQMGRAARPLVRDLCRWVRRVSLVQRRHPRAWSKVLRSGGSFASGG